MVLQLASIKKSSFILSDFPTVCRECVAAAERAPPLPTGWYWNKIIQTKAKTFLTLTPISPHVVYQTKNKQWHPPLNVRGNYRFVDLIRVQRERSSWGTPPTPHPQATKDITVRTTLNGQNARLQHAATGDSGMYGHMTSSLGGGGGWGGSIC